MKKLILICIAVFGCKTAFAQKGDTTNATLTKQGYAVGCNLAKAYAIGDETSKRVYQSTISASHYPQAYKNGVYDGFSVCYKPKQKKQKWGEKNQLTGYGIKKKED